jgi:hypothetical protein
MRGAIEKTLIVAGLITGADVVTADFVTEGPKTFVESIKNPGAATKE